MFFMTVISSPILEMTSIKRGTIVTVLNITVLGSLRREFLSFVIRLDSVPVITQSSTLNLQVRIMPMHIFAYLSLNI